MTGSTGSVTDAAGRMMTPGYVDIHAHGSWGSSFDDGVQGIRLARAGHMMHGTTRQVLSLITNPPALTFSARIWKDRSLRCLARVRMIRNV